MSSQQYKDFVERVLREFGTWEAWMKLSVRRRTLWFRDHGGDARTANFEDRSKIARALFDEPK